MKPEDDLEARISGSGDTTKQDPELPPLEKYTEKFRERYSNEEAFRNLVHKYLGIKGLRKAKLGISKVFFPSWYRSQAETLINEYALRIREELAVALEARKELLALKKVEQELVQEASRIETQTEEAKGTAVEYSALSQQRDEAVRGIESQADSRLSEERSRVEGQKERVVQLTDSTQLVQSKVRAHIMNSPLVKIDELGNLAFDEQKMMDKLEDVFLNEIIEGIEAEEGRGFIGRTKSTFEGLIAYWDEIEELSELNLVDWVQSAILSRTRGFRIPTFPYLAVPKYTQEKKLGRTSIDTAVIVDASESMAHRGRWAAAQKTTLATHALMRKLNPRNVTHLAVYNGNVTQVSSKDIMCNVQPYNGTQTDLALQWLLEKLKNSGPSLAYLVTDGLPNDVGAAAAVAKKFADVPYIKLRIFLIDGSEESEAAIRSIGNAAGRGTKVIPVKNYEFAGGMIKDISKALGEMYDIERF